ncbi:tyrosine-type recombinase/integrase [Amycolatopsis sp. NPDC003731]
MINNVWTVQATTEDLARPSTPPPFDAELAGVDRDAWLRRVGLEPGTPFLISPTFEYDVTLNDFFRSPGMRAKAETTQVGYARDLAAFLTFLWSARGRTSWRDAVEDDHLAYLAWRRRDPAGPMVAGATWDREVAAVDAFYRWAVRHGHVVTGPVPQVARRPGLGRELGRRTLDEHRPATYAHDTVRERVEWLPPASYRSWRDAGLRGYGTDGLPRRDFRGRWAARNATFADLMVRTGLRLSEQASLTVFDLPRRGTQTTGHRRFWLPAAIAKGGSARWVYVPMSVLADVEALARWDRSDVIAEARAAGQYARWRRPWVVTDPAVPVARRVGAGERVKVEHLQPAERRLLLVETADGLEPGMFWLGESGRPLTVSAWKETFSTANRRCAAVGIDLRCHPHMLRHTFAVVTLELLQRGHISALAEQRPEQREHYTRIFGDPLDWVRRLLGHRSVTTTQIYLHMLAQLEMETRLALVPDGWDLADPPVRAAETQ